MLVGLLGFLAACNNGAVPDSPNNEPTSKYKNTDSDVHVLLPAEFEKMFGVNSISFVSYNYEVKANEDGESASVFVECEIKIGEDIYTATAEGEVDKIVLPSGAILWEGPIDGEMVSGDRTEKLTVGILHVDGSDEIEISATFSGTAHGFVFGEDVIKGEVLDYIQGKFN